MALLSRGKTLFGFPQRLLREGTCTTAAKAAMAAGLTRVATTGKAGSRDLISASEVLQERDLRVFRFVDATWYLNQPSKKPHELYLQKKLPGAVFFDIEELSDRESALPHMLPSEQTFADAMDSYGISNTDPVVVYTQPDSFSAARVWWTFKVFGHQDVRILNGGIRAWVSEGGTTESGPPKPPGRTASHYNAKLNHAVVANMNDIAELSKYPGRGRILDARSPGRFMGTESEPRAGLRGGHMPNAINLPFGRLLDSKDMTSFRSKDELLEAFKAAGIEPDKSQKIITSCGSGVTAAVLTFALHLMGREWSTTSLYDGSWSEWGALPESVAPVEK